MPELFERLSKAAFDGLENGNVSASSSQSSLAAAKRRSLQRIWVGLLSDLALDPASGTPPDATVLAAAELRKVRGRARAAQKDQKLAGRLDEYGRAHLEDIEARVDRVLEARLTIPTVTH